MWRGRLQLQSPSEITSLLGDCRVYCASTTNSASYRSWRRVSHFVISSTVRSQVNQLWSLYMSRGTQKYIRQMQQTKRKGDGSWYVAFCWMQSQFLIRNCVQELINPYRLDQTDRVARTSLDWKVASKRQQVRFLLVFLQTRDQSRPTIVVLDFHSLAGRGVKSGNNKCLAIYRTRLHGQPANIKFQSLCFSLGSVIHLTIIIAAALSRVIAQLVVIGFNASGFVLYTTVLNISWNGIFQLQVGFS